MHQSRDQGLTFRKSSYSATANDCVEVADLPSAAAVRDTQNREAGHLLFPCQEWSALLTGVRAGSWKHKKAPGKTQGLFGGSSGSGIRTPHS